MTVVEVVVVAGAALVVVVVTIIAVVVVDVVVASVLPVEDSAGGSDPFFIKNTYGPDNGSPSVMLEAILGEDEVEGGSSIGSATNSATPLWLLLAGVALGDIKIVGRGAGGEATVWVIVGTAFSLSSFIILFLMYAAESLRLLESCALTLLARLPDIDIECESAYSP